MAQPATVHYKAVKRLFAYLYATKKHELTYWRPCPKEEIEDIPYHGTVSTVAEIDPYHDKPNTTQLHGACDSMWASDRKTTQSIGGIALLMAGAAVYYRTNLQPTITLSSTESEFANMVDAGKAALYIRWILDELWVQQLAPTRILANN